jgi:thiol-disulfide isomerase/thioredoxin
MRILLLTLLYLGGQFIAKAQELKVINKSDLVALINSKSDTVYVINFWATWCKPCIEELPVFEKINKDFTGQKVKIILISNDFKKQIKPKLKPFLLDKNIQSEVWWMSETDPNIWINLVEPNWEGSLPATLIFKGSENKRFFHEGSLTENTLNAIINKIAP